MEDSSQSTLKKSNLFIQHFKYIEVRGETPALTEENLVVKIEFLLLGVRNLGPYLNKLLFYQYLPAFNSREFKSWDKQASCVQTHLFTSHQKLCFS